MYLSGSKWNMRKKRRRSRPLRVFVLLILIVGLVYLWQIYVPTVPPLFVATPTVTRSPASFVLEAESLFQAGRLSQAEQAYQQAIQVEPREVEFFIALAKVRMFAGKYSEAETAARDALLINQDSALGLAFLGWSLDFQASQASNPDSRSALLQEALLSTERAIELNPNSALAHAFYAEVLIDNDLGGYEDALRAAELAVELDPNTLETHRALGYIWEVTGNRDNALEAYQTARQLNPNLPLLHIDVGNMLRALGDVEGAIDSYLIAVGLAPENPEPLILIANAYAGDGEFGNASQYAKQAVELDPTNPYLRGNLGRMFYHNNVMDEAIQELGLAIRGGQAVAGVWVEGIPLDAPGDGRVIEFYYTYGLALAKQADCEEAVRIFDALLRAVPEDEIAVFNAQEGLFLCGELQRTPTPETEATPAP